MLLTKSTHSYFNANNTWAKEEEVLSIKKPGLAETRSGSNLG